MLTGCIQYLLVQSCKANHFSLASRVDDGKHCQVLSIAGKIAGPSFY